MGVPQSLAAVLALLALVLAVEGVTPGSTKQLFAGLLLAFVATLTFSFGDTLSTFNIQMVEQLPRWSDVPHPLPEPAPPPAPAKTEAAPPKIQTATSNDTSANLNQEASTKQVTASPHFFAVYPRQKFMSDVNWNAPAVRAIATLYDAMEASEWQKAIDISSVAMRQALAQENQRDKSSYVGHILWLKAIATFESGDHDLAAQLMQTARIYINEAQPDLEDQRHLEIDVGLFAELSGDFNRYVLGDLLQTLERNPANNSHELALLRYEWALRAKKSGNQHYTEMNIGAARSEAAELDVRGSHDEAARLRSVFAAQFPH